MTRVTSNGLQFHVEDSGEGIPVLLLHGFPDTSRLWRAQVAALAGAGFRAIAPDLRGRGRSERPADGDYALPTVVRDVTGILDALGVERAHVVGHDWGAGVAWLLAALAPERVDRLVAISVGLPGTGGLPDLEALQKGWYRLLFALDTAEDLFTRRDWHLMRTLLASHPETEEWLRELADPAALTAALGWYRSNLPIDRLVPAGPARTLPPVQAPTLGIWSAGDAFLTEEAMRRSADGIAGPWRYERIEDAGHWVPLDQPNRLNALLLEFLAASPGRRLAARRPPAPRPPPAG
jgi:pimeloyl-ACP methyl ester carboxylesterase